MAFTDDLRGLSRAAQVARVQAVAREHGDELHECQAAQAVSLYMAWPVEDGPADYKGAPGPPRPAERRTGPKYRDYERIRLSQLDRAEARRPHPVPDPDGRVTWASSRARISRLEAGS